MRYPRKAGILPQGGGAWGLRGDTRVPKLRLAPDLRLTGSLYFLLHHHVLNISCMYLCMYVRMYACMHVL